MSELDLVDSQGKKLGSDAKLADSQGQEIKTRTIPVVKWKGFTLPIRTQTNEDLAPDSKKAISPNEVIRELRAGYVEMQDRFQILAVGLAAAAKENPGGEVDKFLSQCGIVLKDFKGQIIYEPTEDLLEEKSPGK